MSRPEEIAEWVEELLGAFDRLIDRGHRPRTVFEDWLDTLLYALAGDEEHYCDLVEQYDTDHEDGERDIDLFVDAFAQLQLGVEQTHAELLGGVYIGLGERDEALAQHFTPENVAGMAAGLAMPVSNVDESDHDEDDARRVLDPACGSGRMLIAALNEDRESVCIGVDIDPLCAKMTALNLCMFNANGYVLQGDGILDNYERAWKIRRTPLGGRNREIDPDSVRLGASQSSQQSLSDFVGGAST